MVAEMKDKLDRKEFFMQNKERKWLEIEKILEEYVDEDEYLLTGKFYDTFKHVFQNFKSNVV